MQNWMLNEAISNIGLNFLDKGDYEKAIEHYSAEIESNPDNPDLYFWRGRAYREAALALKRKNQDVNTSESEKYFDKSTSDYDQARMLSLESPF